MPPGEDHSHGSDTWAGRRDPAPNTQLWDLEGQKWAPVPPAHDKPPNRSARSLQKPETQNGTPKKVLIWHKRGPSLQLLGTTSCYHLMGWPVTPALSPLPVLCAHRADTHDYNRGAPRPSAFSLG